jgi:hypothetical protein
MMTVMVVGFALEYEYDYGYEYEYYFEKNQERESICVCCWLMGRVENGEEGDLPQREREEWLVFLSLTLYLLFFDAFFFTHKVIIMCV